MTKAFGTVNRTGLYKILKGVLNEDEINLILVLILLKHVQLQVEWKQCGKPIHSQC